MFSEDTLTFQIPSIRLQLNVELGKGLKMNV